MYPRNYNPRLTIAGETSTTFSFDINRFVTNWINNPSFNTTAANTAIYQQVAANILPLFTGNAEYTTGAGSRYGLYRTVDSKSLAYYTNQSIVNGWSIASAGLLDLFFGDLTAQGSTRHLTQASSFLSDPPYFQSNIAKEIPVVLEIFDAPPGLAFNGNAYLANGSTQIFSGTINDFGYANVKLNTIYDDRISNYSSSYFDVTFPTNFINNTQVRVLEAITVLPVNNKKFIVRLRQNGPTGNILSNSQIVTVAARGISNFTTADLANIILANGNTFSSADHVGYRSANIATVPSGHYKSDMKQFVVRLRQGSPTGPIVANSQIIDVLNLGTSRFNLYDIVGNKTVYTVQADSNYTGSIMQFMSNVTYSLTPTTTTTSTSTTTTTSSTTTSTSTTSTTTSTTTTSTTTSTSTSTTTTTIAPPPTSTTTTSTSSTSTTTTSTSTTTAAPTTTTTNAGNWTISHTGLTNGYLVGETITVNVESDFPNALFYVTVSGVGTTTPVEQGPLYTNTTPTTIGGTRYAASTSFSASGLGSIVIELRLNTINSSVVASLPLNIIVITSTSTSTSTTSTTTLIPLPTSTTTSTSSTTSTTTSAAPFSPTTTTSTTSTSTTTTTVLYQLLSAPTISGTALVGNNLTMATDAAWDPAGTSTGTMWQTSASAPPNAVWTDTGDTDNTFTLYEFNLYNFFRLRKQSPDGQVSAFSNVIGPVIAATTTTTTTSGPTTTTTSTSTTSTSTSTTSTSTSTTTLYIGPSLFLDSADLTSYPGNDLSNAVNSDYWNDISGSLTKARTSGGSVGTSITYSAAAGVTRGLNFAGGSVFFEGYDATGNHASYDQTGDLTLDVWFTLSQPPAGIVRIFGKGDLTTNSYGIWYDGTNVYFRRRNNSGNTIETSAVHNITLSSFGAPVWYQVTAISDSGTLKLYINGQPVGTPTAGSDYVSSATKPYTVGAYTPGSTVHNGKISIVRIWPRALTTLEVGNEFSAFRSRHGL